ncbi:sentrin-specific protease 1-like isoform X2 [Rhopalosiphum padi]|uniref:sentrin-specific protease 1-like isoform X2 n=1 Tax=Rhopalosiphum padi TaxID=40932 RepID=UPI00298DBBD7|nr:sentrin-specific protease 1-like isoform X2 [Rhopalosiphum padi]
MKGNLRSINFCTAAKLKMTSIKVENRDMDTTKDTTINSETSLDYYECLNDIYINKYMDLITQRSANEVYVFDTFFFTAFSEKGFSSVYHWTKNINIFSKKKLMIPIYTKEENRWSLVYVDMTKEKMIYYDKFGKNNSKHMRLIMKYLKLEHFLRNGVFLKTFFIQIPSKHLSRNARLLFSLTDMKRFHKQIVCDVKDDNISFLISSYNT